MLQSMGEDSALLKRIDDKIELIRFSRPKNQKLLKRWRDRYRRYELDSFVNMKIPNEGLASQIRLPTPGDVDRTYYVQELLVLEKQLDELFKCLQEKGEEEAEKLLHQFVGKVSWVLMVFLFLLLGIIGSICVWSFMI